MRVPTGTFRPSTPSGMQQVRAEVESGGVIPFEYLFEREKAGWDPEFSAEAQLHLPREIQDQIVLEEARGGYRTVRSWKLVKGLLPRHGSAKERDEVALRLASPDSGSFILVSLRRLRNDQDRQEEKER